MTAAGVLAQNWLNPAGGSWGEAENWSGGAVPGGTSPVAFTNDHEGTATVTLDGHRAQTGGMTFGGGDWLIAPGTPPDSALTLAQNVVTTLDGVTTLAATGVVTTGIVTFRGEGEFRLDADRLFSPLDVYSGTVRLMPGRTLSQYSGVDVRVEGTGTLLNEGGTLNTKILRIGDQTIPTNALFRMTSGTVNAGGSGDAVLLVGYRDVALYGQAAVEILGGAFNATGAVSDANAWVGPRHHGTLIVGGSDIPASLNVVNVCLGWKWGNDAQSRYTTNLLVVATNGTVNADGIVRQCYSRPFSTVRVETGGTLRCDTVLADSTGRLDVAFAGGRVLLNGVSNAVFTGQNVSVAVEADGSELDIGGIDVTCPAPVAGAGWLTKAGAGTLTLAGDLSGFSGGVAVAQGGLVVGGGPLHAAFGIALAGGTALDLTGHSVLASLEVSGAAAVTLDASGLSLGTLALADGGVCTFAGDAPVTVTHLHVPDGVTAEFAYAGHVSILSLTGGGDLTVSGGGTFDVTDDATFTGTAQAAPDGSVLNTGVTFIETMTVLSDATVETFGQTLTIGTLTLAGGALAAAGGGEIVIQNLIAEGAATVAAEGAGAITNIASLTLAPGAVLTAQTAGTVSFGSVQGTGTLRLEGGVAEIAALQSGPGFDIAGGEVRAAPVPSPVSAPAWTAGEPAFWVDASQAASLATVGGRLEWSDRRGGAFAMKAVSTNVVPSIVTEPTLGGLNAVKFASPHNYGQYKGMNWSERLTNIRTIFWVIGAQEGGGQLLGDSENHIDFLRGEYPPRHPGAGSQLDWPPGIHYAPLISQLYADANRDHLPCVRDGLTRIDGTSVRPDLTGYPNPGYHVIAIRTTNDVCAAAFATERANQHSARSGCQRLAECIVFTVPLTDEEIAATEAYLQNKWFGAGIRARSVRIGSAGARFTTVGGNVLLDELRVDVAGMQPTVPVSGVARVERLVVPHDLTLAYDAASRSLPLDAQTVRVEDGATVTVDAPSYDGVWLAGVEGDGTIALPAVTSADIGNATSQPGESLTLAFAAPVPVTVRSWLGQGSLEIAGSSDVDISFADISGSASLAVTGGTATPLDFAIIRATGSWALSGNVDPYIDLLYLYGTSQTLTLDTGGYPLRVKEFHERATLVWNGPDKITVQALRAGDGNAPVLPAEAFTPYIADMRIGFNSADLRFTGSGELTVNLFIVENNVNGQRRTRTFTLAPGVAMTVTNLQHRTTYSDDLKLVNSGTLNIVNLAMWNDRAIYFPTGLVTTAKTLSIDQAGGHVNVMGGTLRVTDSIGNCRNFTVDEGIIFPDGTVLTPSGWDVRSAARFGLGAGSVLTLALPDYTNVYPMTFAGGTLNIASNATFTGGLILDGTALNVAAGQTLSAASLSGHDTVTLETGAVLNVSNLHGFDGVIVNNGGTFHVDNTRTNTIPAEPVVEPTFWVDASQSGSFQTNSSGKLVWLDKRTARDGTPGLMFATALSNSTPPILQNQLNGLPVVDFGPLGADSKDERGMIWNQRITTVQAVHWVIGAQNGGGQLLGDMNSGGGIDWFRYSDNNTQPMPNYRYGNGGDDYRTPLLPSQGRWGNRAGRMDYIHNGTAYLNGVQNDGLGISNGFPSADYHLVSVRTTGPTYAAAFASERVGNTFAQRSGAQRLGEVLVYGVPLTAEQNRANDAYLSWKWFARRLDGYRTVDEDLIALRGSGTVSGTAVLAREVAPAAAGLAVDGNLHLDFYPAATEIGAAIRLDALPAPGVAAISVDGDAYLPARVTVVLGEIRAGTFTVLTATALHGSPEWLIDISATANTVGFSFDVKQTDETVILTITAKGTMMLIQ